MSPILTTGAGIIPAAAGGGGGSTVLFDTFFSTALAASGTSASFPTGTQLPIDLNVGNGGAGTTNRAMVMALMYSSTASGTVTAPSCTWKGSALTLIGGPYSTTGNGEIFLFGMVAPALGTGTFAASWTGSARVQVSGMTVVSALQTGGATTFHGVVPNTGSGTTAGVTTAALSNEMSFAAGMTQNNFGAPSHHGLGTDNSAGALSCTATQYSDATAAPTLSWITASGNFVVAGVAITGA